MKLPNEADVRRGSSVIGQHLSTTEDGLVFATFRRLRIEPLIIHIIASRRL